MRRMPGVARVGQAQCSRQKSSARGIKFDPGLGERPRVPRRGRPAVARLESRGTRNAFVRRDWARTCPDGGWMLCPAWRLEALPGQQPRSTTTTSSYPFWPKFSGPKQSRGMSSVQELLRDAWLAARKGNLCALSACKAWTCQKLYRIELYISRCEHGYFQIIRGPAPV